MPPRDGHSAANNRCALLAVLVYPRFPVTKAMEREGRLTWVLRLLWVALSAACGRRVSQREPYRYVPPIHALKPAPSDGGRSSSRLLLFRGDGDRKRMHYPNRNHSRDSPTSKKCSQFQRLPKDESDQGLARTDTARATPPAAGSGPGCRTRSAIQVFTTASPAVAPWGSVRDRRVRAGRRSRSLAA